MLQLLKTKLHRKRCLHRKDYDRIRRNQHRWLQQKRLRSQVRLYSLQQLADADLTANEVRGIYFIERSIDTFRSHGPDAAERIFMAACYQPPSPQSPYTHPSPQTHPITPTYTSPTLLPRISRFHHHPAQPTHLLHPHIDPQHLTSFIHTFTTGSTMKTPTFYTPQHSPTSIITTMPHIIAVQVYRHSPSANLPQNQMQNKNRTHRSTSKGSVWIAEPLAV